jgi:hypothetical protein
MVENVTLIISCLTSGGIIALIFKAVFRTRAEGDNATLMLVKQLQENVNANNAKMILLEDEVHKWREKYYLEYEEKIKVVDELRRVRVQLERFNAKNQD